MRRSIWLKYLIAVIVVFLVFSFVYLPHGDELLKSLMAILLLGGILLLVFFELIINLPGKLKSIIGSKSKYIKSLIIRKDEADNEYIDSEGLGSFLRVIQIVMICLTVVVITLIVALVIVAV